MIRLPDGLIDPAEIVTNVYPLEKFEEALGMLRGEEDHMKVVFSFPESEKEAPEAPADNG